MYYVAIREDGNICNACSSSGGRITYSQSGSSNDGWSWWDLRMVRHAEWMKLIAEEQILRQIQTSDLLSAAAAKARFADILRNGNLLEIFGDKISGVPTETVLAMTQAQVWGGGAIM